MHKLHSLILVCSMFLFTGCITMPDGSQGLDVNRVARIAGAAAYLGGAADLTANPDHRVDYELAVVLLRSMEDTANYNAADLAASLQGLGVRELSGPNGALYVQAALIVWDEALSYAAPLTQQTLVAAALPQIRTGLERALQATETK